MNLSWADELAELRAAMTRLAAREARLMRLTEVGPDAPGIRPGWPIRRKPAASAVVHAHQ